MSLSSKPKTGPVNLRDFVTDIPDFPKPGILFRDFSPLLRHHFSETIAQLAGLLTPAEWAEVDMIGGIESRGFILAAGLAAVKSKGFVKIRKAGKLPGTVVKRNYGLEYGEDALEMHKGTGRLAVVDDVLATGGTLTAACELAQETGHEVKAILCLINLTFLNQFSFHGLKARTLIDY